MKLRRLVFSAIIGMAAVYVAYPYVTLYRLASAVSNGDSDLLATLVSWDSVRDGVKEDICDAVTDMPAAEAANGGTLPPFGYSFVRGVAGSVVDANISPEALVSAARSPRIVKADDNGEMHLTWAFFHSPREFIVVVGMPGPAGPDNDLRVQMEFRHGGWMVTRAWLPASLLLAANSRT